MKTIKLKRGELTRLAKEAGVATSTIKYRLFPEKRKAQLKKSYLKNRTKRIIRMRDYYEENREKLLKYAKDNLKPYNKVKSHLAYLKRKERNCYN